MKERTIWLDADGWPVEHFSGLRGVVWNWLRDMIHGKQKVTESQWKQMEEARRAR